jgi:hypothetical protein
MEETERMLLVSVLPVSVVTTRFVADKVELFSVENTDNVFAKIVLPVNVEKIRVFAFNVLVFRVD